MKIAFYINTLAHGGAERVVSVLANGMAECGLDTTVITSVRCKNEYDLNSAVKRIVLEENGGYSGFIERNIYRIRCLRRCIKQYEFDCMLSFMAEPNFRSIIASYGLKVKTILSVRNDPKKEYPGKMMRLLANCLFCLADWTVFQTEDAKKSFCKKIQSRSSIILNPVNEVFYQTDRFPNKFDVVSCGRLVEQKNHAMLIEAFVDVSARYEESRLLIYGDGSLRSDLEKMAKDFNLDDKVQFKGEVADVAKALATAGAFVLSSKYEGLPNALMEALAMGVPSVSTDCPCGGPRMLIENGKNGLLVRNDNIEEMRDAINTLLGNAQLASDMSHEAREKAQEFRSSRVVGDWIELVQKITKIIKG